MPDNIKSQGFFKQNSDFSPAKNSFDSTVFQKNLLALLKADPNYSHHLRNLPCPPPDEIRTFPTRSGLLGVAASGRFLTSRFEPLKEAASFIEKALKQGEPLPQTLCLMGCAGGYAVRAALKAGFKEIHVFEPEPGVLSATLGSEDYSGPILDGRLRFATQVERIFYQVHYKIRMEPDLAVLISPHHRQAFPEAVAAFEDRITMILRNADIMSQTLSVKIVKWFHYSLENLPDFIRRPGVEAMTNLFAGKPAVIVSAGPSLDKNIHHLLDHREKVLVISVGTALKKLDRLGLVPDIAVAVESNDITGQFKDLSFIGNIHAALNIYGFPGLWTLPFKGIFGFVSGTIDYRWFLDRLGRSEAQIPVGGSVANAAFSIANLVGADPVILVGQDLAYSDRGELHASGIGLFGAQDIKVNQMDSRDEVALAKDGIFFIESYYGGKVMTKTNLRNYLIWFEQNVQSLTAAGKKAYNCTEGGAKIGGFMQKPFAEVLAGLPDEKIGAAELIGRIKAKIPPALAGLSEDILSTIDDAMKLEKRSGTLMRKIEEAILPAVKPQQRVSRMAEALRLAEKTDKEMMPVLGRLDPFLAPLCSNAILLTQTAFDYEGLSTEQQARMNLQQTYTIYSALNGASRQLIASMENLERRLKTIG